jgi:hypothetical protein
MLKMMLYILILTVCTSCSKYGPRTICWTPQSTIIKQITYRRKETMKFMKLIDLINKAANDYEKTKNEKYKKEWYKLINEYSRQYAYVKGAIKQ